MEIRIKGGTVGVVAALFLLLLFLSGSIQRMNDVKILDIKMASQLDENLMPIKTTDTFPKGTEKIFCWFQWRNAKINSKITAKWHYVTDDIHIMDYAFALPKKASAGGVSLVMPQGKVLPTGTYQVDLVSEKNFLKSITFKVN
jgi:hypothetical protein